MQRTCCLLAILVCATALTQQTRKLTANANLQPDASTKKPAIAMLARNSMVTVLDLAPQNGFLHVRTVANQEGWVAAKYLKAQANDRQLVRKPKRTEEEAQVARPGVAATTARACAQDLASCGVDAVHPQARLTHWRIT